MPRLIWQKNEDEFVSSGHNQWCNSIEVSLSSFYSILLPACCVPAAQASFPFFPVPCSSSPWYISLCSDLSFLLVWGASLIVTPLDQLSLTSLGNQFRFSGYLLIFLSSRFAMCNHYHYITILPIRL